MTYSRDLIWLVLVAYYSYYPPASVPSQVMKSYKVDEKNRDFIDFPANRPFYRKFATCSDVPARNRLLFAAAKARRLSVYRT